MTPPAAWLASFVRRWHTNPDLSHTHDPIAAHQCRVALLILDRWPDASRELIIAALTHDLGESVTGDIPFGANNKDSVAEQLALENLGYGQWLPAQDRTRLKWADRADAYLWAMHHAPWLAARADWQDAGKWLEDVPE